jgi:hypothetical protein
MAVLNAQQLTALRNAAERNLGVHYTKPQFNAALQAIEDRLQLAATRTAIANDIEAAAPGVFSAAEKNTLFGIWCVTAAQRLGVT